MTDEKPVFPTQILTEEMFLEQFAALDRAGTATGLRNHIADANLGKTRDTSRVGFGCQVASDDP